MEWNRDMDAAPKDRPVLLFGKTENGTYTQVCQWFNGAHGGVWPITFMHGHEPPTHWMPLPTPPDPGD